LIKKIKPKRRSTYTHRALLHRFKPPSLSPYSRLLHRCIRPPFSFSPSFPPSFWASGLGLHVQGSSSIFDVSYGEREKGGREKETGRRKADNRSGEEGECIETMTHLNARRSSMASEPLS
jgi:hypothetical protein